MQTEYLRETFHALSTDVEPYEGKIFEIVRQLTPDECDPECQPMYRVSFSDGAECDAFYEEVYHA